MKSIDLEVFSLCRPKLLITSSYYTNLRLFREQCLPLSRFGQIQEYVTDNNYVKYYFQLTDISQIWITQLREAVYETNKNR